MKRLLVACIVAALALVTLPAFAGPYLNSTSMLLTESFSAARWVRANLGDRELARAAHKMAQARSDVGSKITVPKEVRKAHPHLLLSLGKMERAMEAASEGKVSAFLQYMQDAQGEAHTFESVLKEAGFKLPDLRRPSRR